MADYNGGASGSMPASEAAPALALQQPGLQAPGLPPAVFAAPAFVTPLMAQQNEQLRQFWYQQTQEIMQVGTDPIMKSDEDVRMISAEAPVLFARACEMFILELTLRSWNHSEENKRRTLQRNDIAAAITRTDIFDFLVDIVPREERGDEPARPAPVPAGGAPFYMPPAMAGTDGALPRPGAPDPAIMMQYYQQQAWQGQPGAPGCASGQPGAMGGAPGGPGLDTALDQIMAEGFSTPRTPRGSSLCSMLLNGSVVYEEEAVLQFFCMANAALRAKTEANMALGKEKTLLLDCAFLQEQMEQLLTERSSFQEQIATLERENKFLHAERELMGSQLQSAAEEAGSGGEALALLEAGEGGEGLAPGFSEPGAAAAEADRARALEAGTAAKLLRAEGEFASAKADWEEREAALLRSLEAANLAHQQATAAAAPARTPVSAPPRSRASRPSEEASASARRGDDGAARPASAAAELAQQQSPHRADRSDRAGAECMVSCAPASHRVVVKRLALPLGPGPV
ncbi:hypothetical protein WJX81_002335 [Elliptochloris bilobata]|uniref:Core Histone H2A/H2B/H3 domain-containing protein n=1 Tax=Elliptochloris bilobata TaxID=381761 RepID=A0AAW1QYC9_9CHLO